jgi:hypothetical protein
MCRALLFTLSALVCLASCSPSDAGRTMVEGVGSEEFLKLRAGPELGFSSILGLPVHR